MPGKRKPRKVTAQKIAIAERQGMALDLAKQGGSFSQIAETMRSQPGISPKYDKAQAYRDVAHVLDDIRTKNSLSAQQLKARQELQVGELIASLWPFAKQGDLASVDRVIRLLEYEARLNGLLVREGKGTSATATTVSDGSGGTLTIKEVVVQLTGVNPEDLTGSVIDVTHSIADSQPILELGPGT